MSKLTNINNLHRLLDLGYTKTTLAEKLGLGASTLSNWASAGEMPVWASIACEALLQRCGKAAREVVCIIRIAPKHADILEHLCDGLSATFTKLED